MSKNIRNTNQVTITTTPTELVSAGGTYSLVSNGTSNPLSIKGISSSTLGITNNSGYLQIEDGGATTLNSTGSGESLLYSSPQTSPTMYIKSIEGGSGISVTDVSGSQLRIDSTTTPVTLSDAAFGYGSVLYSGTAPNLQLNQIGSGDGSITFSNPGTGVLDLRSVSPGPLVSLNGTSTYQSLVYQPTGPNLQNKDIHSSDNSVLISDNSSWIDLRSAGITGPQGPTGPAGTSTGLQGTGAAQTLVYNGSSNPLVTFDVESGQNITISNISGTKLRFDGSVNSTGSGIGQNLVYNNAQIKEIQAGTNCAVVDNTTYLTINNTIYSTGGPGYSMIDSFNVKTLVFNGLTVVDHGNYLEISNP